MTWTKAKATTQWGMITTLAVDMRDQYLDLGRRLVEFKANEGWYLMGHETYDSLIQKSGLDRKYLTQLVREEKIRQEAELPDLSGAAACALSVVGPADLVEAGKLALERAEEQGNASVTATDASWAARQIKDPHPPPAGDGKDAVGNNVPKHLRKEFDLIPEFRCIMRDLGGVKARLKRLSRKTEWIFDGEFIELQNVHKGVKFGIPHALCPYCRAEKKKQGKCRECRQMGYMPRQVYDKVPVAQRIKGMAQ